MCMYVCMSLTSRHNLTDHDGKIKTNNKIRQAIKFLTPSET